MYLRRALSTRWRSLRNPASSPPQNEPTHHHIVCAETGVSPHRCESVSVTAPSALEADEFLETHEIRWSEVGRMIRRGEIEDGKSLSALMYMQCFRRHH